jgi:hypothetical protein
MTNDYKLILENWDKYVASVESDTNIFLMNEGKYKESSFSLLLEQADKGVITEEELYQTWSKSFDYEWSLMEEGFMDAVKSGVSTVKGWYNSAATKISDMFLTASVQVYQILQRSAETGIQALSKLFGPMKRIMQNHPRLTKLVVCATALAIMFAGWQLIDESMAQAAVKGRTGAALPDHAVDALRGITSEFGAALADVPGDASEVTRKIKAFELTMDSIRAIDSARQGAELIDLTQQAQSKVGTMLKFVQEIFYEQVDILKDVNMPQEAREEAARLLANWTKSGAPDVLKVATTGG